MTLKIIFAGTPDLALPTLQALIDSKHEVVAVYTQPDRPAGRGRELTESPIKKLAQQNHIPVLQPTTLRDPDVQKQFQHFHADLMVVLGYGMLVPKEILAMPKFGCINVHVSLLPRWRGASPIQQAIMAGDKQSGVTIMQMNEGLDTGDCWSQAICQISPEETSGSLHDQLAQLGAKLLLETLPDIISGKKSPTPQDNTKATYAPKIQKKEAEIHWQKSAEELDRFIRGLNPIPIAYTIFEKQPLRIFKAQSITESHSAKPGTVLRISEKGLDVATKKNVLRILQLQMPGKKPQNIADFFNAYQHKFIPMKTILGENEC